MTVAKLEISIISVLGSIDSGSKTERNRSITMSYFGFDGKGGMSMEEAGEPYGLTRESVRQITNRIVAQIKDDAVAIPEFKKAISICEELIPASAEDLENALVENELVSKGFKIEGVINAIEVFGLTSKMEQIVKINGKRFITSNEHIDVPKRINSKATKEISHNGAVSVQQLIKEIEDISLSNRSRLVNRVIESMESVTWIDEDHEWFYFSGRGRNRVISRLKKIFSVMERVHVSNLKEGIARSWNKNKKDHSQVLSSKNILNLIGTLKDFEIQSGGFVVSKIEDRSNEDIRPFEIAIVNHIKSKENGLAREKELEDALVSNVVDKYQFSMALNYSPLINKKERGVYELIGTPFDITHPTLE